MSRKYRKRGSHCPADSPPWEHSRSPWTWHGGGRCPGRLHRPPAHEHSGEAQRERHTHTGDGETAERDTHTGEPQGETAERDMHTGEGETAERETHTQERERQQRVRGT